MFCRVWWLLVQTLLLVSLDTAMKQLLPVLNRYGYRINNLNKRDAILSKKSMGLIISGKSFIVFITSFEGKYAFCGLSFRNIRCMFYYINDKQVVVVVPL
jgi:hypothetical protein